MELTLQEPATCYMMSIKGFIMGKFIDLTDKTFGRLKVLKREENNKYNKAQWLCKCECGNEKIITRNELKSGDSKSCGCLVKELIKKFRWNKGRPKKSTDEREILNKAIECFWNKVDKSQSCWIWKASTRKDYGQFRYKKINLAHRFSYFIHNNNTLENNKLICHTCDNPLCVNPNHLYAGTVQDNANDRKQRGRYGKNKIVEVR